MVNPPKPTELAMVAAISVSYASQILGSTRTPSRPLAIHIFRTTGWKHPLIAELSEEQIAMLETIEPWRPNGDASVSHAISAHGHDPQPVHSAEGPRAGAAQTRAKVLPSEDRTHDGTSAIDDEAPETRVICCAECGLPTDNPAVRLCEAVDCPHVERIADAA